MGWVAKKSLKVQRGDKIVTLAPGDPVPEAETWNTSMYERTGYIELEEVRANRLGKKAAKPVPPPAPEPAPEPSPEPSEPETAPEPDPESDAPLSVDVGAMTAEVEPGEDGELGTDDDKVTIKPKKKKGREKCPGCGKMYKDLSRHKCRE